MAEQMQNAVNDVANGFRLPIGFEFFCLRNRVVNRNENLARNSDVSP